MTRYLVWWVLGAAALACSSSDDDDDGGAAGAGTGGSSAQGGSGGSAGSGSGYFCTDDEGACVCVRSSANDDNCTLPKPPCCFEATATDSCICYPDDDPACAMRGTQGHPAVSTCPNDAPGDGGASGTGDACDGDLDCPGECVDDGASVCCPLCDIGGTRTCFLACCDDSSQCNF